MRVVDGVEQGKEFDDMVADGRNLGVKHHDHMIPNVIDLDFDVLVGKSTNRVSASLDAIVFRSLV
jgi:hypothetical protein